MKRITTLLFCLAFTLDAPASASAKPSACERIERQQQRVMQQLRRPHGAAAANRLHQRRRELQQQAVAQCR